MPENSLRSRIVAAILQIPRGKVSTYGAIARAAGSPRGARVVVRVLGIAAGLPWQRVVGAGGEIKIPGDHGLDQRLRLQAEGLGFRGRRVDMKVYEHQFAKPKATGKTKKKTSGAAKTR